MTRLRLLHLVFLSVGALLAFKAIGLIGATGFVLAPGMQASAQSGPGDPVVAPAETTQIEGAGEQAASPQDSPADLPMPNEAAAPPQPDGLVVQPEDLGRSRSERIVLERLRERRRELDSREANQKLREDLLKATEERIQQRVGELKELEQRIGVAAEKKKAQEDADFANLAKMYEAMKAKDAARIFDRLELPILVKVVRAMKPSKMADVMSKMQSESAERLTVELATGGQGVPTATAPADLPKIRGN